jgi:PAS domain S-box-containing protein
MKAPRLPVNEAQRLEALRQYNLLDTLPDQALDDLTALAAQLCDAPVATISLVDEHRQWFKSKIGLTASETAREVSFCGHAILEPKMFVVPDAAKDERFADNPLVTGPPNIRFYAGMPLVTAQGHAVGVLCVIDRVPRQLKAAQEEALRVLSRAVMAQVELGRQTRDLAESEARLRLALEAAHMGTFDWDVPRNRIIWSVGHEALWGFKPGEYDGTYEAFARRVHPDDLPGLKAEVERCMAAREPVRREFRVVWPDGSLRWVESVGEFTYSNDGQPMRMRGVALETTERKRAEATLREREEQLRLYAEHSPAAVAMLDRNMRYLVASHRWSEDYRLGDQSLVGRGHYEVFPEIPQRWIEIHQRCLAGAVEKCDEDPFLRADGRTDWLRWEIQPWRQADGTIGGIIMFTEDITKQKQLEEQLRQSQKMEAIGQLAGGVAHDFNNILAAMMMQADLACAEEDLPPRSRELICELKRSAERAANLTRQLVAFSRRHVMQPRLLDLNEIVTDLAKMLRRILGEDMRLLLNLRPRPLLTRADAGMLDQVLMNLVVNARDAMPGGGRLLIETSEKNFTKEEAALIPDARPGRYVCLCVNDTGGGIATEHLPHIFEPFFTTKEPGKGTGLGLAMVFGVVKQHGGALQVESDVGRGSTFRVFLPAADVGEAPSHSETAKAESRRGGETILVVEDDADLRALTRVVLEKQGYQVLEAPDSAEALRIWGQHSGPIHLLLTDIVLPDGLNGRELAARLLERSPRLRVVFTSGYSADIAGRELVLQEGQNFIQKPCLPNQILDTVRQCLDG